MQHGLAVAKVRLSHFCFYLLRCRGNVESSGRCDVLAHFTGGVGVTVYGSGSAGRRELRRNGLAGRQLPAGPALR
jgi:hypothetical protein